MYYVCKSLRCGLIATFLDKERISCTIWLWAQILYYSKLCKEMLDLRKKASFFQGIGANPLFALTKTHLYYVISQKGTYYPLGRAFHALYGFGPLIVESAYLMLTFGHLILNLTKYAYFNLSMQNPYTACHFIEISLIL
jgi:hypothetical protein